METTKLKIVYLHVDDLTPYEKNARKHTDRDLRTIKESISQFGMCDPIGVWGEKNIIVEGHGRLMALKELGYVEVPCIRLDHLTDEQRRAYALAHNKTAEMSSWDQDLLIEELKELGDDFNFGDFGFDQYSDAIEVEEDDFDAEGYASSIVEPKAKLGDRYQLGDHILMCGDSTNIEDVLRLAGGVQCDLLFTDPPYNVNVSNSEGMTIENDNMDDAEFRTFLEMAFQCASHIMKDGCPFYVWHGDSERVNFQLALKSAKLSVKQTLIWVKNGFNFGRQDYKWQHEPCLYGWKDGAGHFFVDEYNHSTVIDDFKTIDDMNKEQLKATLKELLSNIASTIVHEDKPLKNDLHPTMKPIGMCADMIKHSSRKGEIVFDLFGGSGSTLIACEQLGRKCYMMEYDPVYVDTIIARWETLTGRKAVKL